MARYLSILVVMALVVASYGAVVERKDNRFQVDSVIKDLDGFPSRRKLLILKEKIEEFKSMIENGEIDKKMIKAKINECEAKILAKLEMLKERVDQQSLVELFAKIRAKMTKFNEKVKKMAAELKAAIGEKRFAKIVAKFEKSELKKKIDEAYAKFEEYEAKVKAGEITKEDFKMKIDEAKVKVMKKFDETRKKIDRVDLEEVLERIAEKLEDFQEMLMNVKPFA